MALFFTILFQLSAAYFYASLIVVVFSYRFNAPTLRLFSNRLLILYAIYWLVLCITEWPNVIQNGFSIAILLEFLLRNIHLILVLPLFKRSIAQSISYTILLILFINPWRESIQNWLVGSMYHVLGETSIVSIQSGGLFLMDHWNIALMILICIHLFMVFHFYNRRSLNSKME